jgi:isoquinoline 1-oxidoreductase beta subunit
LELIVAQANSLSRRNFIGAAVGGAFVLGVPALGVAQAVKDFGPGGVSDAFSRWVRIDADGTVTVTVHMVEMGQGVTTLLPSLVAEELEVDLAQVRFMLAPNGPAYYNRGYGGGQESTGGSASTRGHWVMFREIGAVAREMLKTAAAQRLNVPASELTAEKGRILHAATGRAVGYGELAAAAAKLPVPPVPPLKDPSSWRILGQKFGRLDVPAKVDGSAQFGADVVRPNMLVATIRACPAFGGKLKHVDGSPALKIPGVVQVVTLDNAVAVLANGYWPALKGLEALTPDWDMGPRGWYDDAALAADLTTHLERAVFVRGEAALDEKLKGAAGQVTAEYTAPLLPHLCMEPMNATAEVTFVGDRADSVEIWLPGQTATTVYAAVNQALGISADKVRIHRTFLGGGFGRRGESDVALQAVLLAHAARRPVKLIWSREEDVRHDFYRPATRTRFVGAVDAQGTLTALDIVSAAPSISARRFPATIKEGKDVGTASGYGDMPYAFPYRLRNAIVDNGVPVGYWRAVHHTQNVFFRESFIDELAARAGVDGVSYRRRLLKDNPRALAALDALEKLAEPPAAGVFRGVALNTSHDAICAQAVDLVAAPDGLKVVRMSTAIDVGVALNPDIITAQMESSMIDALSATLFGGVSLKDGGVVEGNFDRLRVLRLAEAPELRVTILETPGAPIGGTGEPGMPAIPPALTAAIFQATGQRLRGLPVQSQGLAFSV